MNAQANTIKNKKIKKTHKRKRMMTTYAGALR